MTCLNNLRSLLLCLCVVGSGFANAAAPATPSDNASKIQFPVEKIKLDNGLTVLLHPNPTLPIISFQQWFRVGSRNERVGRTGLAHFFEHLMFKGTNKYPASKLESVIQSNGGSNNAFTTRDYTGYYVNFPSGKLELAIDIESDRMRNLNFDIAQIQSEREVVKEERRYRVEDSVDGAMDELMWKTVYKVHPYRWPVIGYMADLNAASMDDMKEFYNKYYAPNNAVVVIAGDFSASEARKLIQKYYGSIPSQALPEVASTPEPEQKAAREATIIRDVQSPMVAAIYRAPKAGDPDGFALDLLANILGSGPSSRLDRRLIFQSQVVTEVSAFNFTPKEPGVFEVSATLKPNQNVDNVLAAITNEIQKVRNVGVTEKELEKAKNQVMLDYVHGLKTVDGRARALAMNEIIFGDYTMLFKDLEMYQKVQAKDIQAVAQKYLVPTARTIVRVSPKKMEGTL